MGTKKTGQEAKKNAPSKRQNKHREGTEPQLACLINGMAGPPGKGEGLSCSCVSPGCVASREPSRVSCAGKREEGCRAKSPLAARPEAQTIWIDDCLASSPGSWPCIWRARLTKHREWNLNVDDMSTSSLKYNLIPMFGADKVHRRCDYSVASHGRPTP